VLDILHQIFRFVTEYSLIFMIIFFGVCWWAYTNQSQSH